MSFSQSSVAASIAASSAASGASPPQPSAPPSVTPSAAPSGAASAASAGSVDGGGGGGGGDARPASGSAATAPSEASTYVGGVELPEESDADTIAEVEAEVSSLLPPPAPPAAAPAAASSPPCRTVYDVVDWEMVGRGTVAAEAFTLLARMAAAMRAAGDSEERRQARRARHARESAAEAVLRVCDGEAARRAALEEAEAGAWAALAGSLAPMRDDMVEGVGCRERRVRRRQRKLDHLKEVLVTRRYEAEWEKERERRRKESEWAAYVQGAYARTGQRLERAVREEVEGKLAAAAAEYGYTPEDEDARQRARPTLYQELLRVQKKGADELRERRQHDLALRELAAESPPGDGVVGPPYPPLGPNGAFVVSPPRGPPAHLAAAAAGTASPRAAAAARTPFSAFGSSPRGPFAAEQVCYAVCS